MVAVKFRYYDAILGVGFFFVFLGATVFFISMYQGKTLELFMVPVFILLIIGSTIVHFGRRELEKAHPPPPPPDAFKWDDKLRDTFK